MAAVSVSDPLPVQPLTVNVLPPAVSVRLAVVNPLKANAAPPVTASDVLARATLLEMTSVRVSDVPLSVPLPVQPLTANVLPPEPLSVRLAVVIPFKPSDMPSVDETKLLARVKPALLVAARVSDVPASEPAPVQPLTVNVLPPALVSVRLAVVIPLRLSDVVPEVSLVLVKVKPAFSDTVAVSPMPVKDPVPGQPLTMKVLPPALVSVKLATAIPLKPSDMLPELRAELVKVKPPLADAVTVSLLAALSVSDPLPVQPLTVNA